MKTNHPDAPDPLPTAADLLPLVEEINSDDDKASREAQERAYRILYCRGMARMKAMTRWSHDEQEAAVVTACSKWFAAIDKL